MRKDSKRPNSKLPRRKPSADIASPDSQPVGDQPASARGPISDERASRDRASNDLLGRSPQPQSTQKRRDVSSASMSFVFHVVLLIAIALIFSNTTPRGTDEGSRRVSLVLATVDENDRIEYQESPTKKSETNPTQEDNPLPDDQPPVDPSMMQPADSPNLDSTDPIFDVGSMTQVPSKSRGSAKQYELSAEELRQLEAESKMLQARMPKGSPTSISVFGSGNMTGRSFVFVIDRSQSMGEQGLGVLEEAASQLQSAVDTLEENHRFQVVAYHHGTVTIGKRKLLSATKDKKKLVKEFIEGLAAFGGTEHESALISALSFKPDVIVFLTDGGYPPLNQSQQRAIKRIARAKTQIHCIQFGSGPIQNRNNFMSELALNNQGTYKYVDVRKWDE